MGRRRWVYTQGGKPLPGGPVEVEPVRRSHHKPEPEEPAAPAPRRPEPDPALGGWTDYVPDEGP